MANHGHCGAETCDCGRRTFIPVWVRQDTTVRMAYDGHCRATGAARSRPQSARGLPSPQAGSPRSRRPDPDAV